MKRLIEVSTDVRASLEHARAVLTADPGGVVSDRATPGERAARRFRVMLVVEVADGRGLHQEVVVDVGTARVGHDDVTLPVHWCATSGGHFFPSFAGELRLCARPVGSKLTVRGSYAVPLGPLGRIGDKLGGQRLAHGSLSAFVEQLAGRLDTAVDRLGDSAPRRTAATDKPDVLVVGTENYLG